MTSGSFRLRTCYVGERPKIRTWIELMLKTTSTEESFAIKKTFRNYILKDFVCVCTDVLFCKVMMEHVTVILSFYISLLE